MSVSTRDTLSVLIRPWAMGVLLGAVVFAGFVSGCAGSSSASERPDLAQTVDSGSWYVREQWPHDGKPVESGHFVVYSDGASQQARQRLADLAEEVLAEVVDEMGVDPATMFRFPAGQGKIDLYANRHHDQEGLGAMAYYAGVIIPSFDSEAEEPQDTSVGAIRLSLKHELVHVVEALLKGRFVGDLPVGDPRRMPVWFSEGTAEALSGGAADNAPRSLDEMNGLIAEYGRINPISWRVDLPVSDSVLRAYGHYYYPMAQLAVEYLLDPNGINRSPKDLAAVMLDMGNDVPFASAFEAHLGMSESDYEQQFFALMNAYLPQRLFPFEVVAMGLFSLLAAALMVGSLIWTFRRWPAATATTIDDPARGTPRGFLAEVWMFAVVAIGFTALLLFRIALADLPPYARRTPAYLVSVASLIASAGSLMWAIRRYSNQRRAAYLIPILVLVAIGVTIVAIQLII